jgi:orotate phosphoribosyltransferase
MYSTHYSAAQDPARLARIADRNATKLIEYMTANYPDCIPVLMYRGMSGIANATAVSLALHAKGYKKHRMIYVRKKNEDSHGCDVETSVSFTDPDKVVLVFVDDFISSGETFKAVAKKVKSEFNGGFRRAAKMKYISLLEDSKHVVNTDIIEEYTW